MVIDVAGQRVELSVDEARALRDAAAAEAGRSSAARDLSLLLDRALSGRTLVLRRIDEQTLLWLAEASGIGGELAAMLRGRG